jgi:hypothetical protein
MQIPIKPSDRLLFIQFDLNNYEALPFNLPNLGKETIESARRRRAANRVNAVKTKLVDLQKKIFAAYIPISLYTSGYVLVNVQHYERIDQNNKNIYFNALRYTFVRKEFERKDDEELKKFLPFRGVHYAGLQELCELVLWEKLRIYRNPFYTDGKEIPGQHAISLNLDGRKPLFESNRSASNFVPEIVPDCSLVLVNGTLRLDSLIG